MYFSLLSVLGTNNIRFNIYYWDQKMHTHIYVCVHVLLQKINIKQ
jgi:hypothetical protein